MNAIHFTKLKPNNVKNTRDEAMVWFGGHSISIQPISYIRSEEAISDLISSLTNFHLVIYFVWFGLFIGCVKYK